MNKKNFLWLVLASANTALGMAQETSPRLGLLYAPWRDNYAGNFSNRKPGAPLVHRACPLCTQCAEQNDEKNLILARFEHCFVALGYGPYGPYHVMVIPNRHGAHNELSQQEWAGVWHSVSIVYRTLIIGLHARMVNYGVNFGGRPAGASIPDHVHVHMVPRFDQENTSDSCDLRETYIRLKPFFAQHN